MLTGPQAEYLLLGLLYTAAREAQREAWAKEGRTENSEWNKQYNQAINELDTKLSRYERSGAVTDWLRGFSW